MHISNATLRCNTKHENHIQRKAAIYIRTSSEAQGERTSPSEKEEDCQLLEKEKELTVVHVYRDVEKYRIKKKLVESSGSRSDRPGSQQARDEQLLLTKKRQEFITHARVTRMDHEEFSEKIAIHYEKAA